MKLQLDFEVIFTPFKGGWLAFLYAGQYKSLAPRLFLETNDL